MCLACLEVDWISRTALVGIIQFLQKFLRPFFFSFCVCVCVPCYVGLSLFSIHFFCLFACSRRERDVNDDSPLATISMTDQVTALSSTTHSLLFFLLLFGSKFDIRPRLFSLLVERNQKPQEKKKGDHQSLTKAPQTQEKNQKSFIDY